ncbi:DUF3027 domain-containing protein [Actinotalea sp. Marseille-Q4924]|uniref:DUF3027 domain-containing protein n=1 Tax=Actinotalea sp. Marseille-Q4924 TaxID=2866571 RepID=UPI001CE4633C|nr:DUF3027 domain-containing protein [Actinotalea sp. Marseille-Q4924]
MPTATKDAVLVSAVDLARAAAVEEAGSPDLVGEHLGLVVEGERLVSHRFATTALGQRGWEWTVTVARVPRGRTPSVCEVHLLPSDDAVLAPTWVPWSERIRPGDLGTGDVLPRLPDDERLDQGYEAVGDADADELAVFELGLGRPRVLSRTGRSEAAERWYAGSHGPTAPQAIAASAPCSTCGFLLLMAGSLRTEFGVCANDWSPDDGKVVSMDHGCGAHSETDVPDGPSDWPDPPSELEPLELVDLATVPGPVATEAAVEEPAPVDETVPDEEPVPADEAVPAEEPTPADETVPGEE